MPQPSREVKKGKWLICHNQVREQISVGTAPKKWDPGITALLTDSWVWDLDLDPNLQKESDLSQDPDPTDIQIILPNQFLQKNTIILAKLNTKMPWDEKNYVILRDW